MFDSSTLLLPELITKIMTHRSYVLIAVFCLVASCRKESTELNGIIHGTVRDATSENPIPYAIVSFENVYVDGLEIIYTNMETIQADEYGRFTYNRSKNYDYANAAEPGYLHSSATAVSIKKADLCRFSIYLNPLTNFRLMVRDNPDLENYFSVEYNVPGSINGERQSHFQGDQEVVWNTEVMAEFYQPLYLKWNVGTDSEQAEIVEVFTPSGTLTEYILEY